MNLFLARVAELDFRRVVGVTVVCFVFGTMLGYWCLGCTRPAPTDASVYRSLVSAGCLAATPDGQQAVAEEHALPHPPPWIECLYDGGTVQACEVPCQK